MLSYFTKYRTSCSLESKIGDIASKIHKNIFQQPTILLPVSSNQFYRTPIIFSSRPDFRGNTSVGKTMNSHYIRLVNSILILWIPLTNIDTCFHSSLPFHPSIIKKTRLPGFIIPVPIFGKIFKNNIFLSLLTLCEYIVVYSYFEYYTCAVLIWKYFLPVLRSTRIPPHFLIFTNSQFHFCFSYFYNAYSCAYIRWPWFTRNNAFK